MGHDDSKRDEDGEPLLTFDDMDSSDEEPEEEDNWRRQERSPTPVYDDVTRVKSRKRLVKKGGGESEEEEGPSFEDLEREDSDGGYDELAAVGKRKKFVSEKSEDEGPVFEDLERDGSDVGYEDVAKEGKRKKFDMEKGGDGSEEEARGFEDEDEDVGDLERDDSDGGYDEVVKAGKRKKFGLEKGGGVSEEEVEDLERENSDLGYDEVAAAGKSKKFSSKDVEDLEGGESDGGYNEVAKAGKRKKFGLKDGGSRKREKPEKRESAKGGGKRRRLKKGEYSGEGDGDVVKEMWDTVAGGDSEDDQNGEKTMDDDNFIDDMGVDPADRYGSDNEPRSPSSAPQAEEGEEEDEINKLFKSGKKKKKTEKSAAEIALLVESVMAELEVVAEEDAELNRQSKPAINKLIKLPLLTDVLSKKQLQLEFLDHGVLNLLKNWLEPLPDGSLPSINIREGILRILNDLPIDLDQYDRKEQLKKSGLGKVIMFLSKSDEETNSNRRLAKDLVDKWSRPIFNKSTRFEDMRNFEDERVPSRRPSVKKPMNKASGMSSRDDDHDPAEFSQGRKSGQLSSGQSSSRVFTTRPEAMALDFLVRPRSKIDPDMLRARAKQMVQDQRRMKMQKKLQLLKAPKKKQLQATKLSVEGRGMVKYL